jgi:hypothetical protein
MQRVGPNVATVFCLRLWGHDSTFVDYCTKNKRLDMGEAKNFDFLPFSLSDGAKLIARGRHQYKGQEEQVVDGGRLCVLMALRHYEGDRAVVRALQGVR